MDKDNKINITILNIIIVLTLAFFWLLFTTSEENTCSNNSNEAVKNITADIGAIWEFLTEDSIACFGDSITVGQGIDETYCRVLAERLRLRYPRIKEVNLGIDGSALSLVSPKLDGVGRYWLDLVKRNPRIVVLQYGTNDNYYNNTPGQFREDLEMVAGDILSKTKSRLVLLTIGYHTYSRDLNTTLEFNEIIRDVASRSDALLVDWFAIMSNDTKYLSDNVHLNQAGHTLLGESIYSAIDNEWYH